MAAYTAGFITHVTCRLTAKNRHQLRNPTLSYRVWATFYLLNDCIVTKRKLYATSSFLVRQHIKLVKLIIVVTYIAPRLGSLNELWHISRSG